MCRLNAGPPQALNSMSVALGILRPNQGFRADVARCQGEMKKRKLDLPANPGRLRYRGMTILDFIEYVAGILIGSGSPL